MRPAGGYTPDMYNFAYETDVYKIWADMIAFDHCADDPYHARHYCAFVGRRDGKQYAMSHDEIQAKYGPNIKMQDRMPDALADCMGNQMYVVNVDTDEQLQEFFRDLLN